MAKRTISIVLCLALIFLFPAAAYADDEILQAENSVPVINIQTVDRRGTSSMPVTGKYIQATINIIDETGASVICDEFASVNLRGNSTLYARKKSFNFKLSDSTDLFDLGSSGKWVLLANAFDKTLMRDKLIYDFAGDIGLSYSPASRFVDVCFDGKFLGNYLLVQAIEYGRDQVNIHPAKGEFILEFKPYSKYTDDIDLSAPLTGQLFGLNDIDVISQEQLDALHNYLAEAETALLSGKQEEIEKYFDTASFVDAYIVHEYFKNIDVGTSSTRFYIKDGKLYAGPVWDFDLSCGNYSPRYYRGYASNGYTIDMPEKWFARVLWWQYLLGCDWFEAAFKQRYMELQPFIVNLYMDNELGKNRIDAIYSTARDSINGNYDDANWRIDRRYGKLEREPENSYKENLEFLRGWLKARNIWILRQIL